MVKTVVKNMERSSKISPDWFMTSQECGSEHQRFGFFPGELFPPEVAVAGGGLVNWPLQSQLSVKNDRRRCRNGSLNSGRGKSKGFVRHNDSRPKVKVVLHDLQQLIFVPGGCAVVEDGDGQGVAYRDRVGDLKDIKKKGH